jgi:PmbA protein
MTPRPLQIIEHLRVLLSGFSGIDGAEFFVRSARKLLLRSKNQNLDYQREAQDFYVVVRLLKDNRMAVSISSEINRNALFEVLHRCHDQIRFSPDRASQVIHTLPYDGPIRDIDWGDENLPLIEESEKIARLFHMEEKAKLVCGGDFQSEAFYSQKYIEESLWTLGSKDPLSEKTTYVEVGLEAQHREGELFSRAFNHDIQSHYYYINWTQIARSTARMLRDRLRSEPWKAAESKIFIGQRLAQKILSSFFEALRGDLCHEGASFLSGMIGKKIFSEQISFIDDPYLNGLTGSCLWDAEGVPVHRTYFVRHGVLMAYAHSRDSAKAMNTESTGNAFIDLEQGRHFIGSHNFFLEPSHFDDVDLLKSLGSGLYFEASDKPLSFSIKSGELSMEARGYRIENGEVVGAVHGCLLRTSFQDLFSKIIAVGRDLKWAHHYGSPSFVVDWTRVEAVGK